MAGGSMTPVSGAAGANDSRTTLTPALKALFTSSATPDAAHNGAGSSRPGAAAQRHIPVTPAAGAAAAAAAANEQQQQEDAGIDLAAKFRALAADSLQGGAAAAASFYADKAVTLSGGLPGDVLLLARAYSAEGSHRRAAHLLEQHRLLTLEDSSGVAACHLAARCLAAAGRHDDCLQLLERIMGEDDEDAAVVQARAARGAGLLEPAAMASASAGMFVTVA
jgi:tetratricopeptide (TPR) repeat protein